MKELRIGLAGYYGNDALCDDLIEYAIHQAFSELVDVEWTRLEYGIPPYTGDWKVFDLILLGGGSLLGMPFPGLVRNLKKVKCPFYIFGTGFREMLVVEDLVYLWERANMVSVRGMTSIERLHKQGFDISKIECLGDPIFLLKPEETCQGQYVGGVTRPKTIDMKWMHSIYEYLKVKTKREVQLFNFCTKQGDIVGEKLGYPVKTLTLDDASSSIADSSFWFGNRLHPFCIALINEVPAVGVEIEFRKVEDVCSTLDYPYWIKANTSFQGFIDMYDELMIDWGQFGRGLRIRIEVERIREDLHKYVKSILKDSGAS